MTATARHGISLLVHERPDVVVDQCRNFAAFAPASVVMIHLSASAPFTPRSLAADLARAGCVRCYVNPERLASRWGNVIEAHFVNIAALCDLLAEDATVSFHASNDLLLRPLAPFLPRPDGALYETREVSQRTVWYTGRQFAASPALPKLLETLDARGAVGSQIEGASYPLPLLLRLIARRDALRPLLARLPPVAEEIVFPTWAAAQRGPSAGAPYVLFRPLLGAGLLLRLVPPAARRRPAVDLLQRGAVRALESLGSPDARRRDAERIIAGQAVAAPLWAHGVPGETTRRYCGIKRVARQIDDPLRRFIAEHTRRVSGGGVADAAETLQSASA